MFRATRKPKKSIAESLILAVTSKRKLKRKWAAIVMVMSSEKIAKFKLKLQESKSNLMLALRFSSVWVIIDLLRTIWLADIF